MGKDDKNEKSLVIDMLGEMHKDIKQTKTDMGDLKTDFKHSRTNGWNVSWMQTLQTYIS